MATRQDIRESFYGELATAADGIVPSSNISQQYPSDQEFPTIVHNDAYRRLPMNNTTGPSTANYSDGEVDSYEYTATMEAQFTVLIASDDETEKEQAYEAVRTHFEEFEYPIRDLSDIHPDAYFIEVMDVNSQDNDDTEPIVRADSVTVNLRFTRTYERDVNAIDSVDRVEHAVHVWGDGEWGDGYWAYGDDMFVYLDSNI